MRKILLLFAALFLVSFAPLYAVDLNEEIYVAIESPKYSIENSNVDLKFYIWNLRNSSFNGTMFYEFKCDSDKMVWGEQAINVTIEPQNYDLFKIPIRPTYPDVHWAKARIEDNRGREIYSTQHSFRVHSYEETAIICVAILALASFLYHIFKKK